MTSPPRADRPPRGRFARGWFARGFSQLELVTTITLAGIMSASFVPKMMPQAARSSAPYQALRLADDLRHTRLLAMGWGQTLVFSANTSSWRVTCANAGSCTNAVPSATTCPNPTSSVVDPGHHGPFCVALENGVTLSGPASIQFDLLGRPQYAGTITYSLAANGSTVATVSVAADTGFVTTTELQ